MKRYTEIELLDLLKDVNPSKVRKITHPATVSAIHILRMEDVDINIRIIVGIDAISEQGRDAFARKCALMVVHFWPCSERTMKYLETGQSDKERDAANSDAMGYVDDKSQSELVRHSAYTAMGATFTDKDRRLINDIADYAARATAKAVVGNGRFGHKDACGAIQYAVRGTVRDWQLAVLIEMLEEEA